MKLTYVTPITSPFLRDFGRNRNDNIKLYKMKLTYVTPITSPFLRDFGRNRNDTVAANEMVLFQKWT
eukprot:Awhi_evm1s15004